MDAPERDGEVLAHRLLDCMTVQRASEFGTLFETLTSDRELRAEAIAGLMVMCERLSNQQCLNAIQVIGLFKDKCAESWLGEQLQSKYPPETLNVMSTQPNKISFQHQLLVKLVAALIMINPEKWISVGKAIADQFEGSWINSSLLVYVQSYGKNPGDN